MDQEELHLYLFMGMCLSLLPCGLLVFTSACASRYVLCVCACVGSSDCRSNIYHPVLAGELVAGRSWWSISSLVEVFWTILNATGFL